ncbi:MAG: Zn-dependent hydrolase [Gammaproteobacteria bacterium]|nr:Zn-dependent hydrolase [Gammaproteobacteria bacterium]
MEKLSSLRVNGERLWQSLMDMAQIGATQKGGCNRQTLTDEDKQGRDLFVGWCEQIGCSVTVDAIGNMFARRAGRDNSLAPILAGSHLDTQPTGGKFDGVYGVLAGLEVLRTLEEHQIVTESPLEVAVWTNEEGSRFAPALLGSGVWSGTFDLEQAYAITDKAGKSVGEELDRIGYKGDAAASAKALKAAFEVHIEQGPILEKEDLQIGVLTGIQGLRWYDLIIEGDACHAGPTPMQARKDPFMAAAPIIAGCYEIAEQYAPWGRATFGDIKAEPGSRNTVPERLTVNVDLRHPDAEILDKMDRAFRDLVEAECEMHALEYEVNECWHMPVTQFAPPCVDAVRSATAKLGYSNMEMVSGAGHDSLYIASVAPTSMIFVPCENGISHNEIENAKPEDLEAGCNVLLHAILEVDRQ